MKNKWFQQMLKVGVLVCMILTWGCAVGPPTKIQVSIVNTEPFELECIKMHPTAKPNILWIYPPVATAKLLGPDHKILNVVAGGIIHNITTDEAKLFTSSNVVTVPEFARLIRWLRQRNVTIEVAPSQQPTLMDRDGNYIDTYPGCSDGIDTYFGANKWQNNTFLVPISGFFYHYWGDK